MLCSINPTTKTYTWKDVQYFADSDHVACDGCTYRYDGCALLDGTAEPGTQTTPEWCSGVSYYSDELEEVA